MTREDLEARIYEIISKGAFGGNCGTEFCEQDDDDCDKCLTIAIMKVVDEHTSA